MDSHPSVLAFSPRAEFDIILLLFPTLLHHLTLSLHPNPHFHRSSFFHHLLSSNEARVRPISIKLSEDEILIENTDSTRAHALYCEKD